MHEILWHGPLGCWKQGAKFDQNDKQSRCIRDQQGPYACRMASEQDSRVERAAARIYLFSRWKRR
jgi:hypothetical protein